jgi:hypothetical protein
LAGGSARRLPAAGPSRRLSNPPAAPKRPRLAPMDNCPFGPRVSRHCPDTPDFTRNSPMTRSRVTVRTSARLEDWRGEFGSMSLADLTPERIAKARPRQNGFAGVGGGLPPQYLGLRGEPRRATVCARGRQRQEGDRPRNVSLASCMSVNV